MTAYDSPIYIADAAVYLMAHSPELGIENPYALDEEQLAAAVDLLKEQRAEHRRVLVRLPQGDPGLRVRATPSSGPPGRSSSNSLAEGTTAEVVLPEEGATGWSDTWMIASAAEEPELRVRLARLHRQPGGERAGHRVLR